MGVLNLWKILNVTCQPIDLEELRDKTLAVDLSIWICENASMNHKFANTANNKPHLRALFFRCKSLLEIGCKLIFVREGDVIDLKQDTMKKRNNARFGSSQAASSSQALSQESTQQQPKLIKKRGRFDFVADECTELLKYMGITVIRSPCGEAEKACAFLNMIGRCDGVITDDSDVLLYGARTVYRNFCLDKKSQLTIEAYTMDRIEKELGYNREMLVVLGLLLGCDYDPKGIPGVGKEMACKFLNEISQLNKSTSDFNILDLVRTWTSDGDYVDNNLKYENRIRKAVMQHCADSFPNEAIISEYLTYSKLARALMSDERYLKIKWDRPLLSELQLFNEKKQAWPFDYTASKVVPLILRHEDMVGVQLHKRNVQPARINAIRRRAGRELYEVVWSKMTSSFDRDLSQLTEYVTLESKDWFEGVYPDVAQEYKTSVEAKKRVKRPKKKQTEVEVSEEEQEVDDEFTGQTQESNQSDDDLVFIKKDECAIASSQLSSIQEKSLLKPRSSSFSLRDVLDLTCEEEPDEHNSRDSDGIIVLDSDDDSIIVEEERSSKPSKRKVLAENLDFLIEKVSSIELIPATKVVKDSKKTPVIDKPVLQVVTEWDLDVPFSQRMKQRFENATIFK